MKFTDISKNNQTVTEMVGYTLGKPQTNNRKPVQKKTANPFDKSADDKKSQLQRIKDAGKKNWYAIEGQLDNPGAEDSPVAQAIIRRILLQRTDLLAKHGPERVVAAVDEVADFVGDVDEIGSSDVSGWIRHVEQMLGNMDQSVAEATGDKPFDSMMKTIKKGTAKQATADRREQRKQSQQQARDAFGTMFGGGNPADKLGIRKPGVAEGLSKRDQQDVAAIRAAIERLQAQLSHPNADKAAIQQSIEHERKRLALYGVTEGSSTAMANTTKRLTDPKDGATAKLRAAGDQRREDQLKSRNIAKKNESATRSALGAAVKQINQSALTEACWKGYHKEGMKTMFGKQYPNCVKNKKKTTEDYTLEEIFGHTCPHCDGELVSEEFVSEKQDACYHKVKGRYKVWPSAYASGALVQCRKKGAANWGNKSESITQEEYDQLDENLKKWFSDKWVRFGPDGKIKGDCARGSSSEGKPKCLPQSKAQALGKKGRASAGARKRRQDPDADRSGKAINVNTRKKTESTKAQANKKY